MIFNIDRVIQNPEYLLQCLDEKLGIKLQTIEFEKVFAKKALKSQYSEVLENLKQRYPKQVANSIDLYQELEAISETTIYSK